ncbi:MAG: hypothetical protein U0361_03410 [Nitrospiraceae bacterium]
MKFKERLLIMQSLRLMMSSGVVRTATLISALLPHPESGGRQTGAGQDAGGR